MGSLAIEYFNFYLYLKQILVQIFEISGYIIILRNTKM